MGTGGICWPNGIAARLKTDAGVPISVAMACSYWARATPTSISWARVVSTWV